MNPAPSSATAEVVARAAGRAPVAWTRVAGGGYTPAERWVVEFDDRSRVFAKVGVTELVAGWLRRERRAYDEIAGPFMPRALGWSDGPTPALLLEDLTDATWPPPWDSDLVERTLALLTRVASTPCPSWATPLHGLEDLFSGWSQIAADPGPFLGLGLASPQWLDAALPSLVAHEHPPQLEGDALVHFDVRSDNVCFTADRALLVDWNLIARGNPLFDVAAWLPSLHFEGGPPPEAVSADAGVFAAALAGVFSSRAPQPIIPDAPRVRKAQLDQATTSLPWAARHLELPEPDGPRFRQRD